MRDLPLESGLFTKIKTFWQHMLQMVWGRRLLWTSPVLMLITIVLGVSLGLLATKLSLEMGVLVLASLIILPLALYKPEFILLFMLAISSTLYNVTSLKHFFGFSLVDLCLLFLLGLIVIRVLLNIGENSFVKTPLNWPVFLFFLASIISLIHAVYFLETVQLIRNIVSRMFLTYLIFFVVINMIKTRQQLMTLVGGMFIMASVVAVFMIAQQAMGPSVSIIPAQEYVRLATGVGQEAISGVARVKAPGVALVYVMLLPAFILHTTPEYLKAHKWLSLIPILLLPPALAFSFDRNMWIGATLGGLTFVFVSRFKSKRFILLILTLVIVATALFFLVNVYYPRINTVVDGLVSRVTFLFAGDDLVSDSSTQWRIQENETALMNIPKHPILGVGPGGVWREPWNKFDRLMHYIHNSYFYILLDVGVVGFIPFLWLSIACLIRGFFLWHKLEDPVLGGIVISLALSYMAVLISSAATPRFLEINFVPVIAAILGINEVAIRLGLPSMPKKIYKPF